MSMCTTKYSPVVYSVGFHFTKLTINVIIFIIVIESQNMSTVTGTDSVFASRDSGVAAVSNQKQVAEVDILKVSKME